jgi:hypothetical protein
MSLLTDAVSPFKSLAFFSQFLTSIGNSVCPSSPCSLSDIILACVFKASLLVTDLSET